jgi:hypothetical protein
MPVYIIRTGDDGPVKIGWANDAEARRRQLQVSHPEPLRVIRTIEGSRATERWLHEHFAAHRLHGEWFEFRADMATVESPELDPPIPWRARKKRQPEARLSWDMCWSGNPCLECRAIASGNRLQYLYLHGAPQ